ncbi:MAG: SGNH/GDSL hydrolase family protein [Bacillota bacterium]|nr:SGNH/GDSL hydrolase family protein [Bacillota bacterium]
MKFISITKKLMVLILVIGSLFFLQRLVVPKYVTGIVEGSLIEAYYTEKTGHDVIFVGDCEVYECFSPVTLWNEYGITSFIRGSAQQLIWQSYYLMEETIDYEKPDVFIFNVLAMKYDEPQKEAYNRLTLDGMRLSATKIRAIQASMMPDEKLLDYIFPIFRYHSRWSELNSDDIRYLFGKKPLFHNGYYMRVDVRPVTTVPVGKKLPDYRFGDTAYAYLDQMVELCNANDVALMLIKAPSVYPYWYDEWDEQMVDYADRHGFVYLNFLDLIDETGIDFQTDTYDTGLHMNLSGAEKLSKYIGPILREQYDVPDRRGDVALSQVWQQKTDFYNRMMAEQYEELERVGYLKSLGARPPDAGD